MFRLLLLGLKPNVNSMKNFSRMLFSSDVGYQTCFGLIGSLIIADFHISAIEFDGLKVDQYQRFPASPVFHGE
jgi:hypothetical protein